MSYSFRKMHCRSYCRARSGACPSILPGLHRYLQPVQVCSLAFTVIFSEQMSQVANTTLSEAWGNVLAIPDTNSLTMIQTSIWFVPSIKENDKKRLAGSPHNDKRESSGIPRMPRAASPSSLKNLKHFGDNHDVNHPGPGRR